MKKYLIIVMSILFTVCLGVIITAQTQKKFLACPPAYTMTTNGVNFEGIYWMGSQTQPMPVSDAYVQQFSGNISLICNYKSGNTTYRIQYVPPRDYRCTAVQSPRKGFDCTIGQQQRPITNY